VFGIYAGEVVRGRQIVDTDATLTLANIQALPDLVMAGFVAVCIIVHLIEPFYLIALIAELSFCLWLLTKGMCMPA